MRRGIYGLLAMAAAFWLSATGSVQAALMQGDWQITLNSPTFGQGTATFSVDGSGLINFDLTPAIGAANAVYSIGPGGFPNGLAATDRIEGSLVFNSAASPPPGVTVSGTPVIDFGADGSWFCHGAFGITGVEACLNGPSFAFDQPGANGVRGTYELTKLGPVNPVPLPATGWLLLTAIAGLGLYGRRRA